MVGSLRYQSGVGVKPSTTVWRVGDVLSSWKVSKIGLEGAEGRFMRWREGMRVLKLI